MRWIRLLLAVAILPGSWGAPADAHGAAVPVDVGVRLGSARWRLLAEPTGILVSDSHVLAVTTNDVTVEFLEARTGQRRSALGIPITRPGPPWSAAAFSPDGKRIAAVIRGEEKRNAILTLRTWPGLREERRFPFKKPDRQLPGFPAEAETAPNRGGSTEEYVSALAFSPDGRILAVGIRFHFRWKWWAGDGKWKVFEREENTLRLWDIASGKRLHELAGHEKTIKGILFSADGQTLISAGADGTLCFHDPLTGREKRASVKWGRPLFCVAGSTDGKLLACGSQESVLILDTATGKLRYRLAMPAPAVGSLAFTRDGKLLAAAAGRTIRLWRTATGIFSRETKTARPVTALAFSTDGSRLFSGHQGEHVVRCWDVATLEPARPLDGHASPVRLLGFTPDGKQVISTAHERDFRAWDASSGKPFHIGKEDQQRIETHGVACAGRTWLALCENGIDVPGLFPTARFPPPLGDREVVFSCSADAKRLLTARKLLNKKLALVVSNRQDDKVLREFLWKEGETVRASLSPDGRTVAAASGDVVCFLDVASGKEQRYTFPKVGSAFRPIYLKFSADGSRVVVVGDPSTLRVVSTSDGSLRAEIKETTWDFIGGLADVALSPDGRTLTVGKFMGSLMVWEVSTGQLVRHHRGDCFLFSPDNRLVAILDHGTLRIHDFWSGVLLWTSKEATGFTGNFAFSPDGRLFAVACRDTTVVLHDLVSLRNSAKPEALDDRALEGLWNDLRKRSSVNPGVEDWQRRAGSEWKDQAKGKSARAYEAMGRLMANPEIAIPFLKKRLFVPGVNAERLKRWIADLDSDVFQVRDSASRALARQGRSAGPALLAALAAKPSLEPRLRLTRLLRMVEREEESLFPAYARAIQILEGIGTKEAKKFLKDLAEGTGGVVGIREAHEALRRILSQRR
jgi:WD40 repeat protein